MPLTRFQKIASSSVVQSVGLFMAPVLVCLFGMKFTHAGLEPEVLHTSVHVGDQNFGVFDTLGDLKDFGFIAGDDSFTRIRLTRDFVTQPSFYLWAKQHVKNRAAPEDIDLVVRDKGGNEVLRYTLRSSQPLSWSVEAVDQSVGGFHETVELAVREVSVR